MAEDPQLCSITYVAAIDVAIQELLALESRTRAPAPEPHQTIGTVVDNTISLLAASANAFDGGIRTVTFSELPNQLSLMVGVQRCFLSSIHTAAEAGLMRLCKQRSVQVRSSIQKRTDPLIAQIEQESIDRPVVLGAIEKLRAGIRESQPAFNDYLDGALLTVNLTRKTKATWRQFFRALSIVRNKVSHAGTTLTDNEKECIDASVLRSMLSPKGELVVNLRIHQQVAISILNFFDILCREANVIKLNGSDAVN